MIIAINATAAFKKLRTGVEEYSYQLIKHLMMLPEAREHQFILYTGLKPNRLKLPPNFSLQYLKFPLIWTQLRLSAALVFNNPDALFIPVHVLPLIHPKNSVVTIHGLEYEYYPRLYPWKHLRYLRWSTKYALKNARKIIVPSANTKQDLIKLYGAKPEKVSVVYHGVNKSEMRVQKLNLFQNKNLKKPYILYLGRLEPKKNIQGLVKAFGILKEKYQIPHKLVLAGPELFKVQSVARMSKDIILTGYVTAKEKWALLSNADVFVYPSFYEGFGLPVLEAQRCGVPIVASNVSSLPEILGQSALLVEPREPEKIAQSIYQALQPDIRQDLIGRGYENIKKFSWQTCAQKTLQILTQ